MPWRAWRAGTEKRAPSGDGRAERHPPAGAGAAALRGDAGPGGIWLARRWRGRGMNTAPATGVVRIEFWQIGLAALLVLICGAVSLALRLGLERSLLIAS